MGNLNSSVSEEKSYTVSNGVEIIPAVMPKSLSDFKDKVSQVLGIVDSVQIDLMDGKFVPSISWPYINKDSVPKFLPNTDEIDFGIDLMVENPVEVANVWIEAGAKRIIPHIEALKSPAEELADLKYDDVELGLAINIETPDSELEKVAGLVDFVQFMGIARIGYQGEGFDERTVGKISSFRSTYPEAIISVDGGVNLESAPALIEAGANRLVSGSTIWKSDDIKETIESLRNL